MSFRFETLLRLRKNEENAIQRDMGQINTHLYRQQENLETLETFTRQARDGYKQTLAENPDVRRLVLYDRFFDSSRTGRLRQNQVIAEIEKRAEEKRGELAEAMKRRRIFEILKERDWMKRKKEQQRLETALMDEVAASRWKGERP